MRTRSKRLAGLVAVAAAAVLVVSACGSVGGGTGNVGGTAGFADCDKKPNECNSGKVKTGGTMTATIEKTIQNWNINDADGNTFDIVQVMNGLVPGVFIAYPDLTPHLNSDLVSSAEQTSTSPQTIVYKIKPTAVWSDGSPINIDDFTYNWKTQNGKDCPECTAAATTGYDQIASVEGSDGGKTVTVKFTEPFVDWKALFGTLYPAAVAKKAGDLATPAGLKAAFDGFKEKTPDWSGGPYMISAYDKDNSVTLTPNPKWYGATKPALEKLTWRIITDQSREVSSLQNHEVNAIYPQPYKDLVDQVKQISDAQYTMGKGLVWEHVDLNTQNTLLKDVAVRKAILTAISQKDVINRTVGQFFTAAAPLGSHMFVPGQAGYKDNVGVTNQGSGDVAKAKQILESAGYKIVDNKLLDKAGAAVPQLRLKYTEGNTLRQQTSELIQNELKAIGLDIKIETIKSLGNTLSTGDYDLIVFAWVGTPFLTSNVDLYTTKGGGNYGKYTNPQVDDLLIRSAKETDDAKARELQNQADVILSQDAYTLPLYQKPTFLGVNKDFLNIRDNATSNGPSYNMQDWGLKTSAK
jgi:peptide/nickel transport system substrate-binding protein